MIIYHVVVAIDQAVEADWYAWMEQTHIPDVLNTGYFLDATLSRQLEPASEAGRVTYHIQYRCSSLEQLQAYQQNAAPALQADHTARYQGRFSASRMLLQQHHMTRP